MKPQVTQVTPKTRSTSRTRNKRTCVVHVLPELPTDLWLRVYLMLEDSFTLYKVVPLVCYTWAEHMHSLLCTWVSVNEKKRLTVFSFPSPRAIAVSMKKAGLVDIDLKYIAPRKRIAA